MSDKPRYYITTAIAYPNGPPHIGYGYEVITTDAIARFKRLDGYDVFFLTGTDEHGSKIAQTAARDGITPKQLVDRNSARFQEMAKLLNASNDQFIRTTEPRHHTSSQAIWERMKANGDIYLSKYAGWYSVRDEAYYDASETRIENGVRVGALGTPVEWVEEESYFFKLSAYQDKLLKLYADVPDFVLPRERLNEVARFVEGGLRDLSVSRTTFDWGVKVPGDEKHVMYVWVDALTNYITAAGFPDDQSASFKRWWPADLHVIGKDIVRFHAVYWPAFLMSAGIAVQRQIFSHGWILNRGEKMSKSVGNVADPFTLVEAYGVDPLRYFFMREVSFGQDGNYSHEAIVARINADLSNDLGNLAQRSMTMVGKAFGGAMPEPGAFSDNDKAILAAADAMIGKARDAMNTYALHQVLNAVWAVVADANRYFAGEAPWALAKTDPARQGTVLYVTAEVIRQVAILALPFMPTSAGNLLDLLNIPQSERDFSRLGGTHRLEPRTALGAISPVFRRFEKEEEEPDESDADERTNAIGLFNTGRSWWRSAEYLRVGNLKLTHPSAPVTSLYCHAIELYLKAYLRGAGSTVAQLKKIGHNFINLRKAATKAGLRLPPEQSEIIDHIESSDMAMEARYIVTGFKSLPTNEALSDLANHLDGAIAAALRERGLSIRSETFDTPSPLQQQGELSHDTIRVLVHLFHADDREERDVGVMAQALRWQKGVLQYHLDELDRAGFAKRTAANVLHGRVYWASTPDGRRYVVEHNLHKSQGSAR